MLSIIPAGISQIFIDANLARDQGILSFIELFSSIKTLQEGNPTDLSIEPPRRKLPKTTETTTAHHLKPPVESFCNAAFFRIRIEETEEIELISTVDNSTSSDNAEFSESMEAALPDNYHPIPFIPDYITNKLDESKQTTNSIGDNQKLPVFTNKLELITSEVMTYNESDKSYDNLDDLDENVSSYKKAQPSITKKLPELLIERNIPFHSVPRSMSQQRFTDRTGESNLQEIQQEFPSCSIKINLADTTNDVAVEEPIFAWDSEPIEETSFDFLSNSTEEGLEVGFSTPLEVPAQLSSNFLELLSITASNVKTSPRPVQVQKLPETEKVRPKDQICVSINEEVLGKLEVTYKGSEGTVEINVEKESVLVLLQDSSNLLKESIAEQWLSTRDGVELNIKLMADSSNSKNDRQNFLAQKIIQVEEDAGFSETLPLKTVSRQYSRARHFDIIV